MSKQHTKICPLIGNNRTPQLCIEESCAWWNSKYLCCSMRSLTPTTPEDKEITEVVHSRVTEEWEGITYWDACGNCKTLVRDGWKYCPKCGAKLDWK